MAKGKKVSRRTILKAAGWTAAGVTVLYFGGRAVMPVMPSFSIPGDASGAAWLQITPDGRCAMFSPRSEMGQNATTGLMQIVAEELNLSVDDITLKFPTTTSAIPPTILTAGSMSLALFAEPTARAAAALREAMRARAAARAGVEAATLKDAAGGFTGPDGSVMHYGDIAQGEAVILDAGNVGDAPLYTFDASRTHRAVGRPVAPHQIGEIVTGGTLYASDVRLPGMLYGRVAQPPARTAELARIDDSKAKTIDGLVQIVVDRKENFIGVVCETPGAARAAVDALDVEWRLPFPFNQNNIDSLLDVDAALAYGALEHALADDTIEDDGDWDVNMRFDVQTQSHAMQEPRAAVARVTADGGDQRVEIWTGSQDPFFVQRHAADAMGLSVDNVVVHAMRMGGGFGGREYYEVEYDALRLARAAGKPVKVQWTREDEFRATRHRPGSSHRVRLKADEGHRLTDWWHAFVSGHIIFARSRMPGWLLSAARLMGDFGAARGALPPYAAPATRVEFSDVDLPIDLGSWRSLGAAPNTFVIESAMDELARVKGSDPVEFRLANIPAEQARLAACLRKTRELAEKVSLPKGAGYGRGFACGIYETNSFVAASADVHVDAATGAIRVLRMCCAQDVGLAVNPDQLKAQIEGNMMWGLGMALVEEVLVGEGAVTSDNFDSYPIPRFADAPEFDIEIISDRGVPPAGAGETAIIVAAPAIANALRDATRRRHTKLPIRSAKHA